MHRVPCHIYIRSQHSRYQPTYIYVRRNYAQGTVPHIYTFSTKILVLWSREPKHCANFVSHVFLETRLSSESFEPMIGFLAYLEPKLWLTN